MEVTGFLLGATRNKDYAMLMIFFGCFFVPTFVYGLQIKSTCARGWLNITCDAEKKILIRQVFRGSYIRPSDGGHQRCSYENGDSKEKDVGVTKGVWKDCNLQNKCDVLFSDTNNRNNQYYLQMDYECVSKNGLIMTSVCDGSLLAQHGYIHSPCYPHMATLGSGDILCKCTASLGKATITVNVSHAFQGAENLVIYWSNRDSDAVAIDQNSKHFKEFPQYPISGSFSLSFAPGSMVTDWDRVFWLEFSADSQLDLKCIVDKGSLDSISCQPPERTTSTTKTTTPAIPTISTSTNSSLIPSQGSPTGGNVGGYGMDVIPIVIGTVVPLLIIAAVIPTVIILLKKRRQAASAKATTEDNEGLELHESVDSSAFGCDPESGERLHDSVALSLEVAGASSLHSSPDELDDKIGHGEGMEATVGQAHEPPPSKIATKKSKSGARKRLEAEKGARPSSDSSAGDHAQRQTKPTVKHKPSLERKIDKDVMPSSDEMEPTAAIYATVDKKSKKKRSHVDEKDQTSESGSKVDPDDLYTKVNKSDKIKRAADSNKNKSVLTDDILEPQTGDVCALVDKTTKRSKGKKPEVPPKRDIEGAESDIPVTLDGAPSVVLEQAGVVYAQVEITAKRSEGKKTDVPQKREIEGAERDKPVTPDGTPSVIYAQIQKGNKSMHKSYKASSENAKPETKTGIDAHDQQEQLRPASSNDTDLYSTVDDDGTDAPPVGDPANDSDDDLYSSVDDKVDEDYGYAYAQGRSFDADNEDPDYGEVGDVEESEDAANQSEGNEDGASESDQEDNLYDEIKMEHARNVKIREAGKTQSIISDTEVDA